MAGFKKRSRDDPEDEPRTSKAIGKKQKNASTAAAVTKDDTPKWELGNKRRLTISKFNNRVLVNIREYYEKDGEMLPGKKGISLTTEQWELILSHVPAINGSLRAHGVILKSDGDNMDASSDKDAMDTDSDGKPLKSKAKKAKTKSKADDKGPDKTAVSSSARKKKANIEATSDEEEEDDTEESDDES